MLCMIQTTNGTKDANTGRLALRVRVPSPSLTTYSNRIYTTLSKGQRMRFVKGIVQRVMQKALHAMSESFWSDKGGRGPLWARTVWRCRIVFPQSWYT
jgi:hypothetical protein